jgi:hypothetical protein
LVAFLFVVYSDLRFVFRGSSSMGWRSQGPKGPFKKPEGDKPGKEEPWLSSAAFSMRSIVVVAVVVIVVAVAARRQ